MTAGSRVVPTVLLHLLVVLVTVVQFQSLLQMRERDRRLPHGIERGPQRVVSRQQLVGILPALGELQQPLPPLGSCRVSPLGEGRVPQPPQDRETSRRVV